MNFLESLICLVIAATMAVCGCRVVSDIRKALPLPSDPDPICELAPLDVLGLPLDLKDLLLQPDIYLG